MAGERTDDLLTRVQRAAKIGEIIIKRHCRDRMSERNVSAEDVKRAILSATTAIDQPKEKTIKLEGGKDIDGDDLKVVVAEDRRGLRIVTVM